MIVLFSKYRIFFIFLVIEFFISFHLSAQYTSFENEKDDPIPLPYINEDYRLKKIFENKYKPLDTILSLKEYYSMNFTMKDPFYFMPFSNMGSFTLSKLFQFDNQVYPEHYFQSKINYYTPYNHKGTFDVKSPMTKILYIAGEQKGQTMDFLFTHSPEKRWNYDIHYKGIKNRGYYQKSVYDGSIFDLGVSYNENRLSTLYNVGLNKHINELNGGISDDNQYESGDDVYLNRININVFFNDTVQANEGQFFFYHYFKNKFLLYEDNSDTLGTERFDFIQELYYEKKEYSYRDIATDYYKSNFLNKNTADTTFIEKYNLKIGLQYTWHDNIFSFSVENNHFRVNYPQDSTLYSLNIPSQLEFNDYAYNITGEGSWRDVDYQFDFKHIFKGNSSNNFNFSSKFTYPLDEKMKLALSISNSRTQSEIKKTYYHSNYDKFTWLNDFTPVLQEKYKISFQYKNLLGIQYDFQNTKNHIYYNTYFKPTQYLNRSIPIHGFELSSNYLYKYLGYDIKTRYQIHNTDPSIMDVPSFSLRTNFYYEDFMFKKAMYARIGLESNYYSKYYAPNYIPILGEFSPQTNKQIGNFWVNTFYISANINTMHLYLRWENVNMYLASVVPFNYNQYNTIGYPIFDDILKLGVIWYFFT